MAYAVSDRRTCAPMQTVTGHDGLSLVWSVHMIGENGSPVTPDWVTCTGNRCAGCDASANLCHVLSVAPVLELCCERCTHLVAAEPTTQVQVWDGDYA